MPLMTDKEIEYNHLKQTQGKHARAKNEERFQRYLQQVDSLGKSSYGFTSNDVELAINTLFHIDSNKRTLYLNKADMENKNNNVGKIGMFPSKEAMHNQDAGVTFNTISNVIRNNNKMSHMYVNNYNFLTNKNGSISDARDWNLKAINTFVLDADYGLTYTDREKCEEDLNKVINLAKNDKLPLQVSVISKTAKGFQMMFILDEPKFCDKKCHVASMAKEIRNSLVEYFLKYLGIKCDTSANALGIFRTIRLGALRYLQLDKLNNFNKCLEWKKQYVVDNTDKKVKKSKGKQVSKKELKELSKKCNSLGDAFRLYNFMLQFVDRVPVGIRNITVYSLSLRLKDTGMSKEKLISMMTKFNNGLSEGLETTEFIKTVNSAYEGGKHLNKEHRRDITQILPHELYVQANTFWVHVKKKESEKVRHAKDYTYNKVINYMSEHANTTQMGSLGTVSLSNNQLVEVGSISKTTVKSFKNDVTGTNKDGINYGIKILPKDSYHAPTKYLIIAELVKALKVFKSKFTQFISALLSVPELAVIIGLMDTFKSILGLKGLIIFIEYIKLNMLQEYEQVKLLE